MRRRLRARFTVAALRLLGAGAALSSPRPHRRPRPGHRPRPRDPCRPRRRRPSRGGHRHAHQQLRRGRRPRHPAPRHRQQRGRGQRVPARRGAAAHVGHAGDRAALAGGDASEGTQRYPRERLRRRMAELGSAIGASPGLDWSTLGLRSTRGHVRFSRGRSSPIAWWRRASIRARWSSCASRSSRRCGSAPRAPTRCSSTSPTRSAFANHPYGLSPVGTEASLRAHHAATCCGATTPSRWCARASAW